MLQAIRNYFGLGQEQTPLEDLTYDKDGIHESSTAAKPFLDNEQLLQHAFGSLRRVSINNAVGTLCYVGSGIYVGSSQIATTMLSSRATVIEASSVDDISTISVEVVGHSDEPQSSLALSTYDLICRRMVALHGSGALADEFYPRFTQSEPQISWQVATSLALFRDISTPEFFAQSDLLANSSAHALFPNRFKEEVESHAIASLQFSASPRSIVQASIGRVVRFDDKNIREHLLIHAWYLLTTCRSNASLGGPIITHQTSFYERTLVGFFVPHEQKSSHQVMIPVQNCLFLTLVLVFLWPRLWSEDIERAKISYRPLLASQDIFTIMADLRGHLDPAVEASIRPSWDWLLDEGGLGLYKSKARTAKPIKHPKVNTDPARYNGAIVGEDGKAGFRQPDMRPDNMMPR